MQGNSEENNKIANQNQENNQNIKGNKHKSQFS